VSGDIWEPREPNGKGNGWRVGPAWLGNDPAGAQTRKDAHLIAAAPDMLEALEEALLYLNNDETRDLVRAAIKKARGEK
jgi:hypothetical protein